MTPRSASTRHALEACTLQLHAWKPFDPSKPYHLHAKKPYRSDRSTAPDLSRLSLLDDPSTPTPPALPDGFRWFRKRRRRGSRSVSGRSSDRSVNRRRGGGGAPSAAYATCSDFPLPAGGTDSSGEMFANGDVDEDVSRACDEGLVVKQRGRKPRKNARVDGSSVAEKEAVNDGVVEPLSQARHGRGLI